MPPGVFPQSHHAAIRSRADFAPMADQPALKTALHGFRVELQPQTVIAPRERLIGSYLRGRQTRCPCRAVESIVVPMQDRASRQIRERGAQAGFTEIKWAPADLRLRPWVDPASEYSRHELRSKTDPDSRCVRVQTTLQQTHF